MTKLFALAALLSASILSANAQTVSLTTADIDGVNFNNVSQAAQTPTYFENDGRTLLVMRNGQASTVTATLVTQATTITAGNYGKVDLENIEVTLPAGHTVIVGPFATNRWNSSGRVRVNLTSTTSVSMSAIQVAR